MRFRVIGSLACKNFSSPRSFPFPLGPCKPFRFVSPLSLSLSLSVLTLALAGSGLIRGLIRDRSCLRDARSRRYVARDLEVRSLYRASIVQIFMVPGLASRPTLQGGSHPQPLARFTKSHRCTVQRQRLRDSPPVSLTSLDDYDDDDDDGCGSRARKRVRIGQRHSGFVDLDVCSPP